MRVEHDYSEEDPGRTDVSALVSDIKKVLRMYTQDEESMPSLAVESV